LLAPEELLGIHTNMAAAVPLEITAALAKGTIPDGLTEDQLNAYNQLDFFFKKGVGYASEMSNRPQTLYAVDDSPDGLAAWMLDHDDRSHRSIVRVFSEQKEGLSVMDVLDDIALYWFTNPGVSSARLYWQASQASSAGCFDPRGVEIPVAVSVLPDEIYAVPEDWAKKA